MASTTKGKVVLNPLPRASGARLFYKLYRYNKFVNLEKLHRDEIDIGERREVIRLLPAAKAFMKQHESIFSSLDQSLRQADYLVGVLSTPTQPVTIQTVKIVLQTLNDQGFWDSSD